MIRYGGICLLTALLLLSPSPLFAQNESEIPAGSSAEVIETKVREDSEEELLEKKPPEPVPITEERPPEEKKVVSFFIRKIYLKGEQILEPEILESLLQRYEGREITFDDLNALGKELEEEYRMRGFFAVVYVPPQKIENQEVTLEVILSRMGELRIEGLRYFRPSKTLSYWKIPRGEILRYDKIRASIRAMGENPDRSVKPILQAGKEQQTTDVLLRAEDRFPLHLGYQFDNQGAKLTGHERSGFTLRHNNLLKLDDIFLIGTVFGNNFGALFLHHLIPLTNFGTRLAYTFSHAQVNPQKEFKIYGINATSETYTLSLLQQLLATDRLLLDTHMAFDFKEKYTRVQSAPSVWDRLRVISLGGDLLLKDTSGNWGFKQDVAFGMSPHGDGFALTSRQAESSFFKYTFTAKRVQKLPYDLRAVASFSGQLSPDKLTPQEQFFLGGATTVRGYPESDYGADQGILSNLEFWSPFFVVPSGWRLPFASEPFREQLQLIAFLDYGYGRLQSPNESEHRSANMLGIGGGFSLRFKKYISTRIEWGVPIGDKGLTEAGHSQFHFRLKVDI